MYVIEARDTCINGRIEVGYRCLHEMTAKQLAKAQATTDAGQRFGRISVNFAHTWVKRGDLHTTPLWVDYPYGKPVIRRS